jgi:hypothetical protein
MDMQSTMNQRHALHSRSRTKKKGTIGPGSPRASRADKRGKPNNRSHARHADAADDGRRRGPDVAGLGVEDVVQLGEERREEGEGGAGGEDAPAQHRAGGRAVAEPADVLGVVRVPDRASQQAELRDHERDPALRPRRKSTAG